ncbi:DUF6264 family protein [Microbacterium sp. TNHR37B]|uniref:DUF6264 family protein n=1 Tax=Microbacterium sp. TNHR37B TaxID=1775956 RepID=UPI0007B2E8AF|nr:DUF6264 family protein [Microbacterium sp. TNHR37B]KZE91344.1 hypothetical protein AVP41_00883 [Microbacterium sp. TNHR37B]
MSDQDPTPPPAPRYGEYATPEQQARFRGGDGASSVPRPAEPVGAGRVEAPHPAAGGVAEVSEQAAVRRGDRFVTIALLAYGLFVVVSTMGQLIDYGGFVKTWMQLAQIDATFEVTASARAWGITGAVTFAVGWVLTALASWRAIRRGRRSWWIPIVGAVVSFIVVSLCLSIPLVTDPALMGELARAR